MMFDPANLGASLQPGDKMSLTFHKGQPKTEGPSFMQNASKAGLVPGAPGAGAPPAGPMAMAPAAPAMLPPAAPMGIGPDQRGALLAALHARMGV